MKPIQVFSPYFRTEEILSEIKECLDRGWTGLGFKTVEFEKAWEEYTALPNCHFLSSNTVGLSLAFDILKRRNNWSDNDEVITTPLTFVSTNHAILQNRLKPIFADVDEYLCLDPDSVKSRITPLTKAVIFVGIGGNTGRLDELQKICKANNLKLILDAAHMSGTYTNFGDSQVHVGHEADITVFSFQAVKNLPTADSGMISFKDKEDLSMATKLTWLGIDKDTFSRVSDGSYKWKYHVPYTGYKYHGNSIMASVGLVQLKYLDEDNDRRNSIANKYESFISGINGISTIPKAPYCHKSSRHLYQILINSPDNKINKRDLLMEEFYNNDIFPGVHYIDNTNYPMYSYAENDCPNSKKFSDQLITLPIHLNLTDEDIERVLTVLSNWAEVNL